MPQMAPLNWLSLYFLFLILYLMFFAQNYFHKINQINLQKKSFEKKIKSWKW